MASGTSGHRRGRRIGELHLGTRQQVLDIEQNHQLVLEPGQPHDELRVELSAEFRHRTNLFRGKGDDIGHRVDDDAAHPARDIEDDHDRGGVVFRVAQREFHAHVDDGYDHTAQIDHAGESRSISSACRR